MKLSESRPSELSIFTRESGLNMTGNRNPQPSGFHRFQTKLQFFIFHGHMFVHLWNLFTKTPQLKFPKFDIEKNTSGPDPPGKKKT